MERSLSVRDNSIGIGIAQFSYHRYFDEVGSWEQELSIRWEVSDFLGRAAELGVGAVALETVFLPNLDFKVVRSLRSELEKNELQPVLDWGHRSGLEGGLNPKKVEDLRNVLPIAKALGCSTVRIVAGDQFSWKVPVDIRMERLTPILKELAEEAYNLSLTLAIENHADLRMKDLVSLVEGVSAENLGICFDTGNTVRVGDDLIEATMLAGPLIQMVHLKDMVLLEESIGDPTSWWPSTPFGCGQLDIPGFVSLLRSFRYEGWLFVEMANMHSDWPDEDNAVAESISYLDKILSDSS